jgi:hypothetical protein
MMPGASMQETNDPRNFHFNDPTNLAGGLFKPVQEIEDPDESGNGFNFLGGSPLKEGTNLMGRRDMN